MNVLLTGATGLVGSRLRRTLLARGDTVWAHTRRPQPPQLGTHWMLGKADDPETYAPALEHIDAIINLAGESLAQSWTKKARHRIWHSRIGTTQAIGAAVAKAHKRPTVWLNASAVGYYGISAHEPCDETAGSGHGYLSDICRAWEGAAVAASDHCRLVLLRFGIILAAEGGTLPLLARMSRFLLGGPLGSGQQWLSWVHLEDVVRMICWALDEPSVDGPLNVTAPNAVRQRDLMSKLAQSVSRPRGPAVPAMVLKFFLGQMAEELLLGSQNVVPKKALALGYHHSYAGLEAALRNALLPAR